MISFLHASSSELPTLCVACLYGQAFFLPLKRRQMWSRIFIITEIYITWGYNFYFNFQINWLFAVALNWKSRPYGMLSHWIESQGLMGCWAIELEVLALWDVEPLNWKSGPYGMLSHWIESPGLMGCWAMSTAELFWGCFWPWWRRRYGPSSWRWILTNIHDVAPETTRIFRNSTVGTISHRALI